ncbi:MAG TPA: Na+/H+ antiporter NhaA [Usitatibacter sp.]|nr:Na+/H+ antiporter NhaA [Usitatibacter sp.]
MAGKKYPLELTGGIVLVAATGAALALATGLGGEAWHHAWDRELALISGGRFRLGLSFHHWVNEALMALFFLLVGLELKRELLVGELSTARDAMLPVVAAVGGMAVPALLFAAFNSGTPTAAGWGIPMATDIAFAIGILRLLGNRVPRTLVVFLTALAIADDLGAVLVIALFYSASLDLHALRACAALFVLLVIFNRGGVRSVLPYLLVGVMLWYYMLASGVHATVAGVLLATTIPSRPRESPAQFERRLGELHDELRGEGADARAIAGAVEEAGAAAQSPLQRLEHALSPWVAFAVVPVFALANAGIDLSSIRWGEAFSSALTLGVIVGLVAGKFIGISGFSWLAVRLGIGRLPAGVDWRQVMGAAWLAGIGFTMSLFIAQLAFAQPEQVEAAKLGILVASCMAAALGIAWLWTPARPR